MKRYLILLSSGTGTRFGSDTPKQFVEVCGKMVIEWTLDACDCDLFDEIILVVSKDYIHMANDLVNRRDSKSSLKVIEGGSTRRESCERGLDGITGDGIVIVHNGVQPFVKKQSFENCFAALEKYKAVTCGVKCVYTALVSNNDHVLTDTPDRSQMYSDYGPEGFHISFLKQILDVGRDDTVSTGLCGTVFRNRLGDVYVAEGDPGNIKITYPDDLALAEWILQKRALVK